ncbi:MAG: mannonate oxidoreductase [Epulopiscium sp. Nuni2H_MBin003]|nr:MAG: mannonate oxidoreductase [Epulopiscium sp. Nuni2H_MBin003]
MNENTFYKLDYYNLISHLKTYAVTQLGKNLLDKITPSPYIKVVSKRLAETAEAKYLLSSVGGIPINGVGNIDFIIEQVEKGIVLECDGLLQVCEFLRGCRKLKEFISAKQDYIPILSGYSLSITPLTNIEEEISQSISKGRIDISASKELKRIRRHIDIEQSKIEEKLAKFMRSHKSYLQDSFFSKRGEHYTIPIKSSYKNQVDGTVIDESSKGSTVFIEPKVISKHTVALSILKAEEATEEYRILAELTNYVYNSLAEIQANIEVIGTYDLIFAKGKYAVAIDGTKPIINNHGYTNIISGKHPLLTGNVVPFSLSIGKNYRNLVITGPNAGGKTIVLKAVGLLTLATQLGLFLPVKMGTEISIYEKIFVDIGDNQSLENALSTFSSHVKNLSSIIKQTNKSTLLLFDEIGSGTEPNEGAALAIAILEEVYKKGAITISSTHYGEIKNFSLMHPDFENAAMKFDPNTLEPLYQLVIGTSGESNALFISKKMGISSHILERAEKYIATKQYNLELIMESKIRTEEIKSETINVYYTKGDKVLLTELDQEAIIYKPQDDLGNVVVFIDGQMQTVYEKRVKLLIPATELYPDEYNLDSLFIDFKTRKFEKDIARGSKKALKQVNKEIRRPKSN